MLSKVDMETSLGAWVDVGEMDHKHSLKTEIFVGNKGKLKYGILDVEENPEIQRYGKEFLQSWNPQWGKNLFLVW